MATIGTIGHTLSEIESKARWICDDATGLTTYIKRLPARRSYETLAEDALATAERELIAALELERRLARALIYDHMIGHLIAAALVVMIFFGT